MTVTRTVVTHPSYGGTLTLYYVETAPAAAVAAAPETSVDVHGYGVVYSREAGR